MLVALVALFVALGGTATAAKLVITSSSQIKNGTITRAKIRDGAVDGSKIAKRAIGPEHLKASARASGASAAADAHGLEAYRLAGPDGVAAGATATVATLSGLPAGAYAILAKTVITPENPMSGLLMQGQTISGHCTLDAGGDSDQSRALLGTPGAVSPGEITLQITRTLNSPADVKLSCDVKQAQWSATDTSIIAVPLSSAPRRAVEG